ncbi:STAS domain-containing protein [Kitasatospora sp. NPDC085895]|uniref:STAS domain-containing protein n=1 Tax=Kitasatospora sp. NPDC085895 TaxID=3155057 RepID=UPI00344D19FC
MNTGLRTTRRPGPAGTRVLALDGHADTDTAPHLALHEALSGNPAPEALVVDCSALTFCSSSGLNELLRARRAALAAGIAFFLASPSRQVTRLLDVSDADTVFDIITGPPSPTYTAN